MKKMDKMDKLIVSIGIVYWFLAVFFFLIEDFTSGATCILFAVLFSVVLPDFREKDEGIDKV